MNINKPHDSTRQTIISHASQRRQLSDYTNYTIDDVHALLQKWSVMYSATAAAAAACGAVYVLCLFYIWGWGRNRGDLTLKTTYVQRAFLRCCHTRYSAVSRCRPYFSRNDQTSPDAVHCKRNHMKKSFLCTTIPQLPLSPSTNIC